MTVGEFFGRLLQTLFAVVSLLWVATIVYAQANCSLVGSSCRNAGLLVWILPIFTAPFGVLGLIGSVLMYVYFRGGEENRGSRPAD